jgi:membrane protease YdiL (CAAX protease family)
MSVVVAGERHVGAARPPAVAAALSRRDALRIAFLITAAAIAVPNSYLLAHLWREQLGGRDSGVPWAWFRALALLVVGVVLALGDRRRSGLTIGRVRGQWRRVALVCGVPIAATALVYPRLPVRPFADAGTEMWLLSPFAQDLVFLGVLYGFVDLAFRHRVHPRVAVHWTLVIGALCFAAWHAPALLTATRPGFIAFQMLYVAVGYVLVGLSRQWTGSILYATLTHSVINAIAAHTP